MANSNKYQPPRYIFNIAEMDMIVVDFSLRERISTPFEVSLNLAAEDQIEFDDVMGKPALLTIDIEGEDRYVHGIIIMFRKTGMTGRFYLYQARMVPQIHLLSLKQDSRIFQEITVPDIVKKIMEETGITSDMLDIRLTDDYLPREYCVQYRETDLNFVTRILEEEGIFYFFEHSEDKHILVLGDSTVNYKTITGESDVMFRHSAGMVADKDAVVSFHLSKQIRSHKYVLRDFNFEKPSMDITSEDSDQEFDNLEVYDYPGEYKIREEGKRLAEIRLQQSIMYKEIGQGSGVVARFIPGFSYTLTDHPIDGFNREYLLVEVTHRGSQPQALGEKGFVEDVTKYENDFMVVPATVTVRPEKTAFKPVVEGVQTAIVTGPSGEEIWTDEDGHGRVKVQFHWDRLGKKNDKTSCWIRVSQPWAGAGWGAMFIPRIGQEVIVDFINGDPDRPIIIGRVYHGTNTPPLDLPKENTKSTIRSRTTPNGTTFNELLMEDRNGKTQVVLSNAYGHKIIQDEETQTLTITTRDNHTICMDDKNKNITFQTTNAHKFIFDDENKKIVLNSTDGHSIELDDENKKIVTMTPNGHIFTFDDDNKKIEITTTDGNSAIFDDDNKKISIQSSSGHHVTLDDDGDSVTIEDAGGNIFKLEAGSTITIESGGDIELKAPSGKIAFEASEISLTSDGDIKAEAGGDVKMQGANFEGKGDTEAKVEGGSSLGLKGGSMAKLEGGTVMIN